jgi:methylenetetrahydrofolate--tRNA-(uracil-5-)-methyltransferase
MRRAVVREDAVTIIGAGISGSEAAWQLAVRGVPVRLVEMRPSPHAPAHHGGDFAELVCSNSLKSVDPATAPGMLKDELGQLGSLVLAAARTTAVPAGTALAVDRKRFSAFITHALSTHPLIDVVFDEAHAIPESGAVVVATGPLTSAGLEPALSAVVGAERLAFFDAAAPIVDAATVDRSIAFPASRYGKGEGDDYLNCPFERDEYERFIAELVTAERVVLKDFETADLFQACQPIEEIARRGADALRFGPMKPVGLSDPDTGRRPWAVLQLRAENAARTAYNLVGCQTNLTFREQRRVFALVPGLEHAEFLRLGVMHRNTFIDAPRVLTPDLSVRLDPRIRIVGQLAGTEGYLEAAATGLIAAIAIAAERASRPFQPLPRETALGALVAYATDPATQPYQPMHVNLGLLPPLNPPVRGKRDRHRAFAERGQRAIRAYAHAHEGLLPVRQTLERLTESGGAE